MTQEHVGAVLRGYVNMADQMLMGTGWDIDGLVDYVKEASGDSTEATLLAMRKAVISGDRKELRRFAKLASESKRSRR